MTTPTLSAVVTALARIAAAGNLDDSPAEFDIVYKFVNTYVNVRAENAAASIAPGHFVIAILRVLSAAIGYPDETDEQVVESWFQSDN